MNLARAPNRLNAALGQADVANVARLHHVGDGTYRILDRHVRIEPCWPVDVDVVDAKARQAVREGVLRRSRTPIEPEELAVGSAERAELHAEEHLVAATFQRLADEKLVSPHAVEVTGVEDVHAALDRLVDGRDAFGLVTIAVPAPSAHPHAPEGDGEHRRTARAQSHVVRRLHVQDLRSDFEVAPALKIGDETRLVWAPSKPLSRLRARGRKVEREETREPGEVRGG